MEELYQKYSDLFRENEDLKLRIKYLERRIEQNEKANMKTVSQKCNCIAIEKSISSDNNEEINTLKKEIEKYKSLVHDCVESHKIMKKGVSALLGYEFDIVDKNKIVLHSMYSFSEDDCFIFGLENNHFNLTRNQFTETYPKEIDAFILKGRSVSAFLAHVTLDLFGQNTLQ